MNERFGLTFASLDMSIRTSVRLKKRCIRTRPVQPVPRNRSDWTRKISHLTPSPSEQTNRPSVPVATVNLIFFTTEILALKQGSRFPSGRFSNPAPKSRTGEKIVMTVEEIKDEIRTLSRGEKIEIYRLLDYGVVAEFSSRIGADRSLAIRQEIEQKWKVTTRKSA